MAPGPYLIRRVAALVFRRRVPKNCANHFCSTFLQIRLRTHFLAEGRQSTRVGAHFGAFELAKLGQEARLMPLSYVKPYVKRGKTDAADAEAICEAVTRPGMRLRPVKTEDRQAVLMIHWTRDFLVRQSTRVTNAIRAHLAVGGPLRALHWLGRGDDRDARLLSPPPATNTSRAATGSSASTRRLCAAPASCESAPTSPAAPVASVRSPSRPRRTGSRQPPPPHG